MNRILIYLMSFVLLSLSSGCATNRIALDYTPGVVVETLSSAVSLSIHATDRSMGGHGYLVFRRPDKLHLVVLSPFGTTMLEAFALGEQITLVYPSRMTAYVGRFDQLPEKGGLQGWHLMRWVMDADPGDKDQNGTVERLGAQGFMEKVTFENGLVVSKTSSGGDQVYYENYAVVNGVPVAGVVEMRNDRDDRVRLVLDEPEVNAPLDAAALTPQLDGMTILPLSAIQGI